LPRVTKAVAKVATTTLLRCTHPSGAGHSSRSSSSSSRPAARFAPQPHLPHPPSRHSATLPRTRTYIASSAIALIGSGGCEGICWWIGSTLLFRHHNRPLSPPQALPVFVFSVFNVADYATVAWAVLASAAAFQTLHASPSSF
jgi:hypothetical protein